MKKLFLVSLTAIIAVSFIFIGCNKEMDVISSSNDDFTTLSKVSYSPEDGGFVGKGDVQTPFGWNNKTMQDNYLAVKFRYVASQEAEWECEWWTGPTHNTKHHSNKQIGTLSVQSAVSFDVKKPSQMTGFILDPIDDGELEEVVPTCDGNDKTVVEGSVVMGTITGVGLEVNHLPTRGANGWVLLPNTEL
jgi:hypothetical protein